VNRPAAPPTSALLQIVEALHAGHPYLISREGIGQGMDLKRF